MDLFASRLNTKCKRFCSRFQDPESKVVDDYLSMKEPVLYFEPPQELLISPCRSLSHPLDKNLTSAAAILSKKLS